MAFIVSKIKESKRPKCETCKYRKDCDEVNHKDFCEAQHCGVEYATFCNVRRAPCIKTNTCQLDDYCCEYYEKKEKYRRKEVKDLQMMRCVSFLQKILMD